MTFVSRTQFQIERPWGHRPFSIVKNNRFIIDYSPLSRVICPTKFKNWRTLKSFWGIIYHICGVSLPPIPGHLELGGTQRIDILIKVILHCKMVQIGHFQRVIREVSRGCLMVPVFLTGQDMSIFRWSGEILKKNLTGLAYDPREWPTFFTLWNF